MWPKDTHKMSESYLLNHNEFSQFYEKTFFNFLKNISTMDETPLKSDLISAMVRLFILIFFVFAFQVSGNYLFFQS